MPDGGLAARSETCGHGQSLEKMAAAAAASIETLRTAGCYSLTCLCCSGAEVTGSRDPQLPVKPLSCDLQASQLCWGGQATRART